LYSQFAFVGKLTKIIPRAQVNSNVNLSSNYRTTNLCRSLWGKVREEVKHRGGEGC
jgi:hypothetical protein